MASPSEHSSPTHPHNTYIKKSYITNSHFFFPTPLTEHSSYKYGKCKEGYLLSVFKWDVLKLQMSTSKPPLGDGTYS